MLELNPDFGKADPENSHLPEETHEKNSLSDISSMWTQLLMYSGDRKIDSLKDLLRVTSNAEHVIQYEKQHHTKGGR